MGCAAKKIVEQIRGPKSVFNQGKLYSLAISPDNRLLAVGGFLAIGTETNSGILPAKFASMILQRGNRCFGLKRIVML